MAFTLPKGAGANHWIARPMELTTPLSPFGALDLVFDFTKLMVTGAASAPPCRPGLSWKLVPGAGDELKTKHIPLTLEITLEDGSTATSTVDLTKQ